MATAGVLPSNAALAETRSEWRYGTSPDRTLHGKLQRTRGATQIPTGKLMSVLGIEVRSGHERNIGRLVDLLAEPDGKIEAAVIEFGGFLGVGSRKIAIAWQDLHLEIAGKQFVAVLEIPREQLRTAPEYKPGAPTVVAKAVEPPVTSTKEPPSSAVQPAPPRKPVHRSQKHHRGHAMHLRRSSRSQR
jgi:hypothetical protein